MKVGSTKSITFIIAFPILQDQEDRLDAINMNIIYLNPLYVQFYNIFKNVFFFATLFVLIDVYRKNRLLPLEERLPI